MKQEGSGADCKSYPLTASAATDGCACIDVVNAFKSTPIYDAPSEATLSDPTSDPTKKKDYFNQYKCMQDPACTVPSDRVLLMVDGDIDKPYYIFVGNVTGYESVGSYEG